MPERTNERLPHAGNSGLALIVKDIAHIAVLDTVGKRDLRRASGCCGVFGLSVIRKIWMERREVKRDDLPRFFRPQSHSC